MSIKDQVEKLNDWRLNGETITRIFKFETYLDSIDFVKMIGTYAEGVMHHPGIKIGYKEVTVGWTTHSENALTEKDIDAAKACNRYYKNYFDGES